MVYFRHEIVRRVAELGSRQTEIILALIYVGIVGFLLDRLMAYIAKLVVPEENK